MKVVLLAGGMGTRLREETEFKPKPMVEIAGRPILWHIMKLYAHYGVTDYVICLGYKGNVIKDYFLNYEFRNRDFTIGLGTRELEAHTPHGESGWSVTLADTGEKTQTGGRLKRVAKYVAGERFLATYGDGVANVDISKLLAFHRSQGKLATVTAVRPASRFGELAIEGGVVKLFREKPQVQEGWINGGFFVFEPEVMEQIRGDQDGLEHMLISDLAQQQQLAVFQHDGFWQCMDTYREMELLNEMWRTGNAPWAVWLKD